MNRNLRKVTDAAMIILLPLLMAYSLIGEQNHEILGICMFFLFIAHHVTNRKWWKALFKGKYNAKRAFGTAIDLLLAVYMILQPVSGILMSKHILTGISITGAAADLRTIHMTLAYWGFVLLSMHLGLHLNAMLPKTKAANAILAAVSVYGVYAFVHRGLADYLFMRVQFAYFDPSASVLLFLLDYLAVMIMIASIVYFTDCRRSPRNQ